MAKAAPAAAAAAAPLKKRLAYKPMYLAVINKLREYQKSKASIKTQKKLLESMRELQDNRLDDLFECINAAAVESSKVQKPVNVFPAESFVTPEGQETGRGVEGLGDDDEEEESGRHVSRKLIKEFEAAAADADMEESSKAVQTSGGKGLSRPEDAVVAAPKETADAAE